MDITTRLYKAMADHMAKTGRKVSRIYLGHSQMLELKVLAEEYIISLNSLDMKGKDRIEYYGVPVFEVDDDDHINVS